jgi:hypothetical protein
MALGHGRTFVEQRTRRKQIKKTNTWLFKSNPTNQGVVGSSPAGRANIQVLSQSARLAFCFCPTFARSYPLEALNSVMLGVALAAEIRAPFRS